MHLGLSCGSAPDPEKQRNQTSDVLAALTNDPLPRTSQAVETTHLEGHTWRADEYCGDPPGDLQIHALQTEDPVWLSEEHTSPRPGLLPSPLPLLSSGAFFGLRTVSWARFFYGHFYPVTST